MIKMLGDKIVYTAEVILADVMWTILMLGIGEVLM